jgi:hypothetical protein
MPKSHPPLTPPRRASEAMARSSGLAKGRPLACHRAGQRPETRWASPMAGQGGALLRAWTPLWPRAQGEGDCAFAGAVTGAAPRAPAGGEWRGVASGSPRPARVLSRQRWCASWRGGVRGRGPLRGEVKRGRVKLNGTSSRPATSFHTGWYAYAGGNPPFHGLASCFHACVMADYIRRYSGSLAKRERSPKRLIRPTGRGPSSGTAHRWRNTRWSAQTAIHWQCRADANRIILDSF